MERYPLVLTVLVLGLIFSTYMVFYTSSHTRPVKPVSVRPLPFFSSFNPSEAAVSLLSLFGDSLDGGLSYMPAQGCETFRFKTTSNGTLILYYCSGLLRISSYYPGPTHTIPYPPLALFQRISGSPAGQYTVEYGGDGYGVVRVYQRFGEKVLFTGVQVLMDKSSTVRRVVIYPFYNFSGLAVPPPPNLGNLEELLKGYGLNASLHNLEGVLVCGSRLGYLLTFSSREWGNPRYVEALIDVYDGGVLYVNFVTEYGVDTVFGSLCQ
ncbi:MAG: hypothetical protein QXD32_03095 [Nitrososphaerota archaeon]